MTNLVKVVPSTDRTSITLTQTNMNYVAGSEGKGPVLKLGYEQLTPLIEALTLTRSLIVTLEALDQNNKRLPEETKKKGLLGLKRSHKKVPEKAEV